MLKTKEAIEKNQPECFGYLANLWFIQDNDCLIKQTFISYTFQMQGSMATAVILKLLLSQKIAEKRIILDQVFQDLRRKDRFKYSFIMSTLTLVKLLQLWLGWSLILCLAYKKGKKRKS